MDKLSTNDISNESSQERHIDQNIAPIPPHTSQGEKKKLTLPQYRDLHGVDSNNNLKTTAYEFRQRKVSMLPESNILESTKLYEWGYPLLYNMFKEFIAVIAFFMCNSRIGASDPNATPLILFGTLVVFAFPHMNPYLFTFMRTGPWLGMSLSFGYIFAVSMQIVGMTVAQCVGAIAAASFRYNLSQTYGYESVFTSTGYVSLRLNKKCDTDKTKTLSLFPPYFTEQLTEKTCFSDLDNISRIWWTLEELFGVAAFLIGTIHIMEALLPTLLINTFWSQSKKTEGEEYSKISTDKKNDADDKSSDSEKQESPYNGIPIQFIAVESMFFAAMQKAFPTSHLALQVTVYLAMLENLDTENEGVYLHKSETPFRILGGVLGTMVACLYYYLVQKDPYLISGFIKLVTKGIFFSSKAPELYNNTRNLAITFKKNDITLDVKHLQL